MVKRIFFICCLLISVRLQAQTEMTKTPGSVTIENKQVSLTFDLKKGVYSVKNIPKESFNNYKCLFPGGRFVFHRFHGNH